MEGDGKFASMFSGGFGTVPTRRLKESAESSGGAMPPSNQPVRDRGVRDVADLFAHVDVRWASSAKTRRDGTVICIQCGRGGHPCCGLRYWTSLRAAWLRTSEEEIVCEPSSFEDAGSLQLARADLAGPIRDLSEGEFQDLEDCLDAVQRPFPRLRRSVPLMQAVQCAEALWDTDD
mmetsp:Transcript_60687/g.141402  ORF Transcript_60687/g.141402 Transcript_60687/m.141402 type:complete len:176 (-) Transcript_60687:104-631(-)